MIEELALTPARIAGNSFGASITLRLAAERPDLFRGAIAHEPPLFSLLADDPAVAPMLEERGERIGPAAMADKTWRDLGDDVRGRYDAYVNATKTFQIDAPHHYLNMIGVRSLHHGQGLARPLLEAVRRMAAEDPTSCGVLLTTEREQNVGLYEHFGYVVVGHVRVSPSLESWGLFLETRGG